MKLTSLKSRTKEKAKKVIKNQLKRKQKKKKIWKSIPRILKNLNHLKLIDKKVLINSEIRLMSNS